ncbi:MAG: cation:proton antiporter, partial [Vicinamibacterales bacterium]
MAGHGLLQDVVLIYAGAVVLLIVAARLRVPAIVALIASGVLAGPSGLGLVGSEADVEILAEVGIALLLFMAGLDFSVAELRRVWRRIVFGGAGQVLVTAGLVAAIAWWALGAGGSRLAFFGLFVALSSTAIVIKELTRLNQASAPHGRLAVGVLLLQDLIVIAVLALAPVLLDQAGAGGGGAVAAVARLAVVLGGLVLVSRVVLPRLLRLVSGASREAFSVAVLLASVGTAWLTQVLGLSMAVGAFLAGLVLAESEFSHQIHAEVRPARDLLASLFFITVGMLVEPAALVRALPLVAGVALAMVVIKGGAAGVALAAAGAPLRVAVTAAVVLAQVGEFSFVLGRSALEAGLVTNAEWQVLLAASVLTMMVTPTLIGLAPAAGVWVARRWPGRAGGDEAEIPALSGHVVILGYGVGGQLLARALRDLSVDFLILELNGGTVRDGAAAGLPIHYADATAAEPLEAAGVARAAAVVAVLSDPDATVRAVRAVRGLAPEVPIIARARYRIEADRLHAAGATLAVAEELEASLEVMAQLFARLQMPGNVVEVLLDTYRRTAAAETARPMRAPAVPLGSLPADVSGAPVATHRLAPGDWAVGRAMGEVALRTQTGATVLAVRRGGAIMTSPTASLVFGQADYLYLMGDEADVRLARAYLATGPIPRRSPVPA